MQVFDLQAVSDGKLWVGLLKLESEGNLNNFLLKIGFPEGMTVSETITARRTLVEWNDNDTFESFKGVVLYPKDEQMMRKLLTEIMESEKKESLRQLRKYLKDKVLIYDLSSLILDLVSDISTSLSDIMTSWADSLK